MIHPLQVKISALYHKVYPNPAHHQVTLKIIALDQSPAFAQIYDSKGQRMAQKSIDLNTGINNFDWDVQFFLLKLFLMFRLLKK